MQPRSAPSASSVTNAPRRSAAPGTSGTAGSGQPVAQASTAPRARRNRAARSAAVSSGAAMVRLSPPDGVGTVELLVDDHASQLVRQGQGAETPDVVRARENGLGKRIGTADRQHDVPPLPLPAGGTLGQIPGRPRLAAARKRDEAGSVGDHPREPRLVFHLGFLGLRVVPQAAQVLVTRRPERRILHAAHRDDAIVHQAYIPRSRCIAATRSTATMYDAMRVFTLYFSAAAATSLNARTMMLSSRRFTVSSSQKYPPRSCTHSK